MEQFCKISLCGIIGTAKTTEVAGTKLARMSVAVNTCYRAKDGTPVIETNWYPVVAYEGQGISDLSRLEKGKTVKLTGRIRVQRYTDNTGADRQSVEVLAQTLDVVED